MATGHDAFYENPKGERFFLHIHLPQGVQSVTEATEKQIPVLFCVHGAGMSGDNFTILAQHLCHTSEAKEQPEAPQVIGDYTTAFSFSPTRPPVPPQSRPPPHPVTCPAPTSLNPVPSQPTPSGGKGGDICCVSYDMRCHGQSTFNGGEASLSLEVLINDFIDILHYVSSNLFPSSYLFLLGHSLGAAVVAGAVGGEQRERLQLPLLSGCIILDAVEGTAKLSISYMKGFLQKRPTSFASVEGAEKWFLTSGGMRTPSSACVSVPPLLKQNSDSPPLWEWRTNLMAMEPHWASWFDDLDSHFLQIEHPKILCVASVERLDKDLTVAHMQGKYQLEVCGTSAGHYIQDDTPGTLASKIHRFVARTEEFKRFMKNR